MTNLVILKYRKKWYQSTWENYPILINLKRANESIFEKLEKSKDLIVRGSDTNSHDFKDRKPNFAKIAVLKKHGQEESRH